MSRGYIETLLDLPWDKRGEDRLDLKVAEDILEKEHYGLEKVKERILEFLAVRKMLDASESPILCLVGPPGTGKTSVARSIAEALNKKYVRICLGGVQDVYKRQQYNTSPVTQELTIASYLFLIFMVQILISRQKMCIRDRFRGRSMQRALCRIPQTLAGAIKR